MRWAEGRWRNSHLLPGWLWMDFHFYFTCLSAFDGVLVLLCLLLGGIVQTIEKPLGTATVILSRMC